MNLGFYFNFLFFETYFWYFMVLLFQNHGNLISDEDKTKSIHVTYLPINGPSQDSALMMHQFDQWHAC